MQSSVCHCIVTAPDHVFLSFSPPSIMELREIEKWDVIEEYFKDFSYFFNLVSRRFFLFPKFVIFVRVGSVINSITNLSGVKDTLEEEPIAFGNWAKRGSFIRISYEWKEYWKIERSDSFVWFINRLKFFIDERDCETEISSDIFDTLLLYAISKRNFTTRW